MANQDPVKHISHSDTITILQLPNVSSDKGVCNLERTWHSS